MIQHLTSYTMMIFRAFAAVGAVLVAPQVFAEPPAPMKPVDMISLRSIGGYSLSPDGSHLAYVRSVAEWEDNYRRGSVWMANTDSGDARQWLYGREDVGSPVWSPDGAWLAFKANEPDGSTDQVYVSARSGGDAFPLTASDNSVSNLQWLPGGSDWIYFLATDERDESNGPEIRHLIRPFDSGEPKQLWRVSVPGGRCEKLTLGPLSVRSFHVSSAGIVLHRTRGTLIDDKHRSSSLWCMELDGADLRPLAGPSHVHGSPQLSPNGERVLYTADVNAVGEPYYQTNLFVFDTASPEARKEILADESFEVIDACWGPEGNKIFLSASFGVDSQLMEFDLATGATRKLTAGEHDVRSWTYEPSLDAFVVELQTATSPGELWRLDRGSDGDLVQLTHEFDDLASRYRLPTQELINWEAEDGTTIEGLLTKPNDGSSAPYPLVVQSHGGPRSSDTWGIWKWGNYQPVLASRGFATLRVNYRGSTGYGEDFHRGMVGNYWRHAHTDVLSGIDHLVDGGIADPDRLAAMGWSAGGHMTNKLVTVTDRFKAASSGAGASDWVSMYGESDTRSRRSPWFGGSPWQKDAPLDAFREQSPLFEAWRVTTPTLILVGEEDRRVPRTQSILFARALTDAGVPNRLYVAPGQGHGWARLDQRLFKINAELEWFERYVRGNDYEWQPAPDED